MDPIDLFVAYVILSSLFAWSSAVIGPSAMLLRLWRWRRSIALADREALELLAGRSLPSPRIRLHAPDLGSEPGPAQAVAAPPSRTMGSCG